MKIKYKIKKINKTRRVFYGSLRLHGYFFCVFFASSFFTSNFSNRKAWVGRTPRLAVRVLSCLKNNTPPPHVSGLEPAAVHLKNSIIRVHCCLGVIDQDADRLNELSSVRMCWIPSHDRKLRGFLTATI
jgi:hypothetical protein